MSLSIYKATFKMPIKSSLLEFLTRVSLIRRFLRGTRNEIVMEGGLSTEDKKMEAITDKCDDSPENRNNTDLKLDKQVCEIYLEHKILKLK